MDVFIAILLFAAAGWLLVDWFRYSGHERDEEDEK